MSTSLVLRNVSKVYGRDGRAVSDFSLDVAPGEFLTLLGPSGSGKTTVLKMIAGFETPTAGEIELGGESVVTLPPYRRGIGMVFQNYALFPHMTVFENVAFPLSVRDVDRREIAVKAREALALVHLEEFADRYPTQLSGGQQQRVALARAVVFRPRILLMDEPLGALDRNLRERMKTEIKRIQRELRMTVVYVTHDQDEALTLSDRIAVMRDGRLVQAAPGPELYNRPADSFVARFVGESNIFDCEVVADGAGARMLRLPNGALVAAPSAAGEVVAHRLMIRPERISILRGEEVSGAALSGRIREAVFLGETTRYEIDAEGLSLTVKDQNRGAAPFPVGAHVALTWRPDDAVLLSD